SNETTFVNIACPSTISRYFHQLVNIVVAAINTLSPAMPVVDFWPPNLSTTRFVTPPRNPHMPSSLSFVSVGQIACPQTTTHDYC
uniref:Ovule protein n=1 Tax=Mesocestoides corti TaxID=53468 RepID=A0A5K3G0N1_MESCO